MVNRYSAGGGMHTDLMHFSLFKVCHFDLNVQMKFVWGHMVLHAGINTCYVDSIKSLRD